MDILHRFDALRTDGHCARSNKRYFFGISTKARKPRQESPETGSIGRTLRRTVDILQFDIVLLHEGRKR